MKPYLSVVICTFVRTHRLIECLKSVEKQTLDSGRFELIIVSKGLCLEEIQWLDEYARSTLLVLKHIREERPGLSVARNVGLRNAMGEVVLFLDDDTIAHRECLEAYVDAFKSTDALCAGGRILPEFVTPPPRWLQPGHWAFLGTLDLGDEICSFDYPANFPVGANVAYRAEVFERFGSFDEDLGIHGLKTAGGEETDLCYRIEAAGGKLLYVPRALVYHCIEADKLKKSWMRKTAYRQGRGAALLQLKHSPPLIVLGRNLLSMARRNKRAGESARKAPPPLLHQRAFRLETRIALALGYGVEMMKALFG